MNISSSRFQMPRQATQNSLMIGFSADSDLGHFVLPRNGIQFSRQLSYEKWSSIGRQLSALGSSSAWCLGDWLVHGEIAYAGRYRDAVEQTSLDYQTLRNYAWVARRFELSRRRDRLSFGHHAEVASLPVPEQDFWLRKAQELSWSRNQLRREVRASLAERAMPGEQLPAHRRPPLRRRIVRVLELGALEGADTVDLASRPGWNGWRWRAGPRTCGGWRSSSN